MSIIKEVWEPVPLELIRLADPPVLQLYCILLSHCFRDKITGKKRDSCWPAQETLTKECGYSLSTLNRAKRRLIDEGWLIVEKMSGNRNKYILTALKTSSYDVNHQPEDHDEEDEKHPEAVHFDVLRAEFPVALENYLPASRDLWNAMLPDTQLRAIEKAKVYKKFYNLAQPDRQQYFTRLHNWLLNQMYDQSDESFAEIARPRNQLKLKSSTGIPDAQNLGSSEGSYQPGEQR